MSTISEKLTARVRDGVWKTINRLKSLPIPAGLGGRHCPVCNNCVGGFLPLSEDFIKPRHQYGYPYRMEDSETLNFREYLCPKCGATDRERLYAMYFRERLSAGEVQLLDIAPAAPLRKFLISLPQVRSRTADLFRKDVDDRVDITAMPLYPDGRFDVFICSHVLEHVIDDCAAMRELYRILRPGGWGIAMVPLNKGAVLDEDPSVTDEAERWRRFGQWDHVRCYTREEYLARLRGAGFVVRELGSDYFGAERFALSGITSSSILYVVEKPA